MAEVGEESPRLPLRLGCPVWNCDAWAGSVYPQRTPKRSWLNWYSRMFNTVEGNNSFYAIPALDHARRWATESAPGFQFCMKFPREISHELALVNAERPTRDFLAVLEILAEAGRLGPTFLQLGPEFGPDRIAVLENFLRSLPGDMPWAVEVRHLGWFDSGENELRLNAMLQERRIDKVIFDSRPLYQRQPDDEIERVSQTRKPKTPIRQTVTAARPMLRLVGRNRIELVDEYLSQWAPIINGWVAQGLEPIVFTHAPDDAFAPALARRFWERLATGLPTKELGSIGLPALPARPVQLGLFDS